MGRRKQVLAVLVAALGLTALVLAGLLTCFLKKLTCGCPVGLSLKLGVFVALVHNLPNLIWWHFPVNFTLVSAADLRREIARTRESLWLPSTMEIGSFWSHSKPA